jgi:hypothetical protein
MKIRLFKPHDDISQKIRGKKYIFFRGYDIARVGVKCFRPHFACISSVRMRAKAFAPTNAKQPFMP